MRIFQLRQADLPELSLFAFGRHVQRLSCACTPLRDQLWWEVGWYSLYKTFFFLNQVSCGVLEFRFKGFIKCELPKGLRGKPHLSCTQILADDSATAEGLLFWITWHLCKVGVQPAKAFIPTLCCFTEASQVCFWPGKNLGRVREILLFLFLTTRCHAGRWPNLWWQVLEIASNKKRHV